MKETRLLLENTHANGAAVSHGSYEVEDARGRVFTGTLDEAGRALVVDLAPGPARVQSGDDPAAPWDKSSYIGTPTWPPTPVQRTAANPDSNREVPW
ncbi:MULTISPECIES: hypothetical protein [Burkholderia]|uniref:hypothetical protein n=1 Tax=Burkholderia TaxID=32008 RepID=UPI00075A0888|nr:hypothetical protein [Burkholderia cepacia]KVW87738.1 hypothetical protein WL00_14615 [Burkholderia cepacia]KVX73118.1 hypothetical protein WL07_00015 [Burkholderia cepacia]MCA8132284.1 hypothetical protein [Burkholderia cepacia]MDN7618170.1 hypothetical protein [Burkholderia cepacia]MDN7889804.1 hypothetical protein [Burkholderia cepacia]